MVPIFLHNGIPYYEVAEHMPSAYDLKNDEIISVLTHEQFENMKYVVGDK